VSEQKYRVVSRPGQDMLHRYPAFEECNLDDAEVIVAVTENEGWGMVTGGSARACAYCFPLPGEHDVSEPS
jgi:hypothetical protein